MFEFLLLFAIVYVVSLLICIWGIVFKVAYDYRDLIGGLVVSFVPVVNTIGAVTLIDEAIEMSGFLDRKLPWRKE